MSEVATRAHRCCNCHAPLLLSKERAGIVRCNYCGSDHKVSDADAERESLLLQEQRLGRLVAPFVLAGPIGLLSYLAARDFWWAPYDGHPAMALGIFFLLTGLLSFRMPAALGLCLVGLAGVLKPFLRPLAGYGGGEMSPTSETAFYYLIPGVIATFVGFLFFASLKVRELRPALRALVPKPSVALVALAGLVAAHLLIGKTIHQLALGQAERIRSFQSLALAACRDELEQAPRQELSPPLHSATRAEDRKNTLLISCGETSRPGFAERDPLHIDELKALDRAMVGRGRGRYIHRGAREHEVQRYRSLKELRYLLVVFSTAEEHHAQLVDIETGTVVRNATILSFGSPTEGRRRLLSALRGQAQVSTELSRAIVPTATPVTTSPEEKAAPLTASFEVHGQRVSSTALWFYGMLTNTSEFPIAKPEVLVVFKDEDGKELGSSNGYGAYALAPAETGPIAIVVSEPPDYASVEFEVHARDLTSSTADGLVVLDQVERETSSGKFEVSGKIKNEGEASARFIEVHMSIFDSEDKLIDLARTYAKSDSLAPGAEARFLVSRYRRPAEEGPLRVVLAVRGKVDPR